MTALEDYVAKTGRAWRAILATEDGQTIMADLVQHFGYTSQSTFSKDPLTMAHREGQRSVLIHIGLCADGRYEGTPNADDDPRAPAAGAVR